MSNSMSLCYCPYVICSIHTDESVNLGNGRILQLPEALIAGLVRESNSHFVGKASIARSDITVRPVNQLYDMGTFVKDFAHLSENRQ